MNKKGFTLIELLAVIVILAIIALIATPIVLDIISDSKESTELRSADFYLSALELSIAKHTMDEGGLVNGEYQISEEGNVCLEGLDNKKCLNNKELVVEVKGKKPKSGTIIIENGKIVDKLSTDESKKTQLVMKDKTLIMENGQLKNEGEKGKPKSICQLQEGYTANEIGSKYECEVKSGIKYYFYVLSYNDENNISTNDKTQAVTTNLIMDRNICKDGTPTSENKEDKCLVAYNSLGDASKVGPITAMEYLNEATKSWSNITNLNITYNDEGGNFTDFKITGKARMIYKSEVSNKAFLYENLKDAGSSWETNLPKPTNNISGVPGFWTFYTISAYASLANYVNYSGIILASDIYTTCGVRPVITLKI